MTTLSIMGSLDVDSVDALGDHGGDFSGGLLHGKAIPRLKWRIPGGADSCTEAVMAYSGVGRWRRRCLVANRATLPEKWPPPIRNVADLYELTDMSKPTEPPFFRADSVNAVGVRGGGGQQPRRRRPHPVRLCVIFHHPCCHAHF